MKMKLQNIAAGLMLASVTASTMAADVQLTGTFKTIKNVTITNPTPMVIEGLHPATGSQCILTIPNNTTAFPGETTMQMANTAVAYTLAPAANHGAMTGTDCSTAIDGTPGIFIIDGAEGADVTITLTNTAVVAGLQFDAEGCASDYDGNPDGDDCTNIPENTGTVITLAASGDLVNSAGQGTPVSGQSVLALGGELNSSIGLTAATGYTLDYDVTVTY